MSISYELLRLFGWAQNEVAELKLDLVPISLCKICNSISSGGPYRNLGCRHETVA